MLTTFPVRTFAILFVFSSLASAAPLEVIKEINVILGTELTNLRQNSSWNPGNKTYDLYDKNLLLDLRPSLEMKKDDWAKLTLRPRLEASVGTSPQAEDYQTKTTRDLWLNEGFFSFYPTETAQLHIGRQNFLWGPSEIVSPSNPFYPDLLNRPNPLFQLRGVTMARLNYSVGENYHLIFLSEISPLNDADFQMRYPEEEENLQRLLMKPEYSSSNGEVVTGLTLGRQNISNEQEFFYGGYGMWSMNDALQLYADFRVDELDAESFLFGVTGIRWTFKDGTEWRNEFIYKESGLNEKEFNQLEDLIKHPLFSGVLLDEQHKQQDNLKSEQYYYSSLRKILSNFGFIDRPILGLRSLYSMTNQSGIISSFFEAGLDDNTTLTTYLAQTYGSNNGEFNQVASSIGGIFLRLSY